MFIYSPLEQFEINLLVPLEIFQLNFSITNLSLFLFFIFMIIIVVLNLSLHKMTFLPNSWQSLKELFYNITRDLVKDNIGTKGEVYFPLIFVLHLFLLTCNLIGMVPYAFTLTSHIIFTFGLSFFIFLGVNFIGIQVHGKKFFSIFLPPNVPLVIVPLITTIEIVSYLLRVFTLAIRLFANMTSGHTLLKIVSGFSWTMLSKGGWLSLPLLFTFNTFIFINNFNIIRARYSYFTSLCFYIINMYLFKRCFRTSLIEKKLNYASVRLYIII